MVLQPSSPSKHNAMLGGARLSSPRTTKQDGTRHREDGFETPPAKRVKRDVANAVSDVRADEGASHTKRHKNVIPDSEDESGSEDLASTAQRSEHRTGLETALPPIQTDREAIEAYETSRAAGELDPKGRLSQSKWIKGKSSIYVDAFNLALETVLEEESHLFDAAEHAVFDAWRSLDYEAQYLYVRLFLRKTSSWFRVNRLGYHSDVGDLPKAIAELQRTRDIAESSDDNAAHPGELGVPEVNMLERHFTFADRSDDSIKDLEEASSLLLLDELKAIAKDVKVQGKNKSELLRALRRTSGKQSSLGFASFSRSDTETTIASAPDDEESREATSNAGRSRENRDSYFVEKILVETGPCVRLSIPTLKLFERVHLVFYRSTEWTEKSLTTIILARISRWNFPDYIVSRSANVFPSRAMLLEFEAAVRTQFRVDNILEFNGTPTKESFQTILDIFEEVYPRWHALMEEEQRKEDRTYDTGEGAYLRRLSPTWVYTRIVHKGAFVLGRLKDHEREHSVICSLLSQRLFHAARRGDWYQRKALLEEHYMHLHLPSPASYETVDAKKKYWKRIALRTCEEGLEDQLTHLVYHHDLQKRTMKLEKALKVPKRQQHEFGHVRLTKPVERSFTGVRIERPPGSRRGSEQGVTSTGSKQPDRRGAKTIWLDPALTKVIDPDTGEEQTTEGECSVEHMCLSKYRVMGYKGYHCESSLIRTLFGYLFFDVLFIYLPNVFQTPYQTCPLDLHTDAFYPARMSEVNRRLAEIENGAAGEIVKGVWERENERKTCVVGLDWTFEIADLLEICQVFPPVALGCVMKVLAQEYAARGAGVPDLFLWKPKSTGGDEGKEEGGVAFAEVKSENDRLSDAQRMWIDVLSGAGVRIELCHAVASEVRMQE